MRNSSCSKWNHICGRKSWLSMDTNAEVATELKQYRMRCDRMNRSRILYFSDFGGIFGFSLGISMISFFTCFQWLYKSIARTITCKDSVSISSFSLRTLQNIKCIAAETNQFKGSNWNEKNKDCIIVNIRFISAIRFVHLLVIFISIHRFLNENTITESDRNQIFFVSIDYSL